MTKSSTLRSDAVGVEAEVVEGAVAEVVEEAVAAGPRAQVAALAALAALAADPVAAEEEHRGVRVQAATEAVSLAQAPALVLNTAAAGMSVDLHPIVIRSVQRFKPRRSTRILTAPLVTMQVVPLGLTRQAANPLWVSLHTWQGVQP